MWKLRKFFMPYWYVILAIIALLFGQAMADLSLPEYMAKIVNNGIQTGGIEGAKMEIVASDAFENMQLFLTSDEKEIFKDAYELVTTDDAAYAGIEKKFEGLEKQDVYQLVDMDDKQWETAEPVIAKAVIVYSMLTGDQGGMFAPQGGQFEELLTQIPAGVSVFDFLQSLPDAALSPIKEAINTQFSGVESSSLATASASFIVAQYKTLGVDTDAYQINYMIRIGLVMLGLTLLGAIATISVGFLSARTAAAFGRDVRDATFSHVTNFSNQEFDKFSTASLITRTTNDITQIQMVLVMLFRFVFYAPMMGIGGIIKVLNADASMLWITILGIVLLGFLILFLFSIALPKFKVVQTLLDRLNLVTRESLTGMLVIRAFSNEEYEEEKFEKANADLTKLNLFVNRATAVMMPSMMFIMNVITLMIVWFGAKQIDLGTMQVGDMMAFMQYSMQIIMSFFFISIVFITLPRATVSANRIAEILNTPLSVHEPVAPIHLEKTQGVVRFNDVCFAYPGAQECVLNHISFEAKPGQTTAFIGSTGSGKSTLINLVPRFYDISAGSITVDGVDIRDIPTKELREQIGFVPQKGLLFTGTIGSNIKFADANLDDASLQEITEIAQAADFVNEKPNKFDEPIAQGGTNVSGGQKQRLAIARALARKPKILVFDDSFSALDFKTDQKLRHALKERVTDTTILLVAQRVASIMQAEQIIVLDQGNIVGTGTHDELMKTCSVYQEIAASQLSQEDLENGKH